FMGGDQDVFYCPAQDERCEWKKVAPEPGAPGRATEEHAKFGYEVGEPLLDTWGTYFSYGYNAGGTNGATVNPPDENHLGLGFYLEIRPLPAFIPVALPLRANRVRKPTEMVSVTDSTADGF